LTLIPSEWEEVPSSAPQPFGRYTLVRELKTGRLLDRYQLFFPTQSEYLSYLDSI
jgi:hypothetical protein